MAWNVVRDVLVGLAIALAAGWLVLLAALIAVRPRGSLLSEALRILPDMLRLLHRLAADPELPRGVRVRLGLLLAYLAVPVDLVPDFVPVLGHADDAIIATAVLRSVVRRAGLTAVRRRWPGTDDGFAALCRLTGLASNRGASGGVPNGDPAKLPAGGDGEAASSDRRTTEQRRHGGYGRGGTSRG